MKPSAISVQRVYEGIGPDGSYRALVDRMWPRGLRRADEYQRVLQLEAMALGFGFLLFGVFVAGLLDAAAVGDLRRSVQISIGVSVLVWAGALELRGRAR